LLNTEVTFIPDIISEYYPSPMPNLYKGMQLIITGRYDLPQDVRMVLSGKAFNLDVEYVYDISLADTVNPNFMFLPKLWAKQKIEYLTYLYYSLGQNSTQAQAVEETIEQISICYQVLSEFTSFVDNGTTYYEEILADKPEFSYSFSPNPFDTQTSLVINLKMPALISVSIYDSKGIMIYSILENGIAGENILTWNGDDSRGKQVDSGIYFYTVRIGNESYFGKIVKL
ncbi:MAG: T9SS type A sorting domain-containing protein, partial [Bacteroidales bacterium]|nr:T9SS type A sorting domain-containing protein [Bacteroidales bacterium]